MKITWFYETQRYIFVFTKPFIGLSSGPVESDHMGLFISPLHTLCPTLLILPKSIGIKYELPLHSYTILWTTAHKQNIEILTRLY
jgi:hypothetical protein